MSLYRRPDTAHWWCRFQLDNREIRLSTGTRDKSQAKEFEAAARARAWRQSRLGQRPAYPWEAARKRWLAESHRPNDPSVLSILKWFDSHLRGRAMQEITREVLEELRALKAEQASCATADRHMERLRAILRKCRDDWQVLDSIPKVPMYRARTAEPRWLTREQFAALARKLPRHLRLAARLAVATGLRMRSQSHLSWDRIDTHAARAWVPGYQMKGGKALGIPLSKRALRTLRALKAMNPHSRFVHPAPGGGPTDDFNTRAFKSAVAAAALAPLRWHDLRHTWASWQVQAGTSLQELQELGGWASYSSVLRYAHLAPEHLAQAAERLWVRSRVAQKLAQRRAGSSGGGK